MIWMSGVTWGRALGGGGHLMTGQDPRLCHLGFHYRITTKKIATRLFHYQITAGAIYMDGWWWRIMLY